MSGRKNRTGGKSAGRKRPRQDSVGQDSAGRNRAGRILAGGLAVLLLGGTATGIGAAAFALDRPAQRGVDVPLAAVPAGDFVAQCPATARLPEGATVPGTDPAFAASSKSARTAVRAVVLSDLAQRVPGASVALLNGKNLRTLSDVLPAAEAERTQTIGEEGTSRREAVVVSGLAETAATALSVQALGGRQSVASMVRSYTADDGDLAGLAVSRCQSPASDQWLLGASTTVGSTAVLVLANPSGTAATVNLELHGAEGPIDAANTSGLVLAPGESRSIVLAGLAAGEAALSVRVRSAGGPVTALIQQSVLRGLTPGGVDYIEPAAAQSPTQAVPGVAVQDPAATRKVAAQDGYSTAVPELRVVVPGTQDATLRVRALGPDGEAALPGNGTVTAAAGATTAVALDGLPAGTYTLVVESDVAVVAGARLVRGTKEDAPVDAAWASSAERIGSEHLLAVAQRADAALAFGSAEGSGTVELRPVDADGTIGAAQTVAVAEGTTALRKVSELGGDTVAVLVSSSGAAVYGAQVLTLGNAGISAITIPPAVEGQRGVQVDIRY
ncbi:DUF5719 family protein [Arthrobacter ginkgonis]|uniref:DUF5719 family protein n=1 Tax=Arthrobacter ginkgonis TaxID=1630594 RepID=A0ABP7C6U1_9MICC